MGESTNTFLLKYEKRAESRAEVAEVAAELDISRLDNIKTR